MVTVVWCIEWREGKGHEEKRDWIFKEIINEYDWKEVVIDNVWRDKDSCRNVERAWEKE